MEPELALLGRDTLVQGDERGQKETFTAQPRAGRWKYFHYVPRYPTPAVRAQRALLCLVPLGNAGGTEHTAQPWAPKTCIQPWHNTATVEEDIRNKK